MFHYVHNLQTMVLHFFTDLITASYHAGKTGYSIMMFRFSDTFCKGGKVKVLQYYIYSHVAWISLGSCWKQMHSFKEVDSIMKQKCTIGVVTGRVT